MTNDGDRAVSVLDGATDAEVATWPLGGDLGGVAADATTGRVYAAAGMATTAAAALAHGRLAPGWERHAGSRGAFKRD